MQATGNKVKRKTHRRQFCIVFLVAFLILTGVAAMILGAVAKSQYTQKVYYLESKANDIKDKVDMLIARVHVMAFTLMADEGEPDSFHALAPLVLKGWDNDTENTVLNVALAPEGVVRHVYPLEGNEPLIGYDLWEAAAPNPQTVEILQQGRVHITPPIALVQGGQGLNISLPVTLPGQDASWGIVAIVVDTDALVSSFRLNELTEQQVEYSLSYQDMEGNYVVLAKSGIVERPMTLMFETENISWQLSITGKFDLLGVLTAAIVTAGIVAISLLIALTVAEQLRKREMNQLFRKLANTDSVTGCASRHYVYETLVEKATGKWRDEKTQYALAILDVDKFKTVNDTYGHEVGDEILQRIAGMALEALNDDKDCVVRYGGDEFVLLYANRTLEQMRAEMEKLHQAAHDIRLETQPDVRVTVSIGAVHPHQLSEQVPTYKTMLHLADEKLYMAKEAGRDACRL